MPDPAAQSDPLAEITALLRAVVDRLNAGQAEGLSPEAAAAFVGISLASWNSMTVHGMNPAPSYLTERTPRWTRTELKQWLLAGSPARQRWQAMRITALRAAG